jgi:hypothetical protein
MCKVIVFIAPLFELVLLDLRTFSTKAVEGRFLDRSEIAPRLLQLHQLRQLTVRGSEDAVKVMPQQLLIRLISLHDYIRQRDCRVVNLCQFKRLRRASYGFEHRNLLVVERTIQIDLRFFTRGTKSD